MKTLRLDPSTARGAAASQVFEEVKFIPLETTKESLFGSISQFSVTKDNYVIYDYDTKAVLIFDKAGKYIAKVNSSKIAKDPKDKVTPEFHGYVLKTENNQDYIQISSNRNIFYFDLKGQLYKKGKWNEPGISYGNEKKFSNDIIIKEYYVDKKEKDSKDSTFYDIGLVKDKKKVAAYFPFHPDSAKNDENWGSSRFYNNGVPDELFYTRNYEYNIYKLTPEKLSLAYRLIFPAINSLPADYGSNPKYRGKRSDFFTNNKKAFYRMDNVYQTGDNLYLNMKNFEWNKADKESLIYNLKSGMLTSVADIEPDTLSQFLPVTDASNGYEYENRGFLTFEKGYFYTSYSSLAMLGYKELNEGKNRKYDPLLTEYFKTQNRKSNPVIILLKPKNN
ncbi:MAG: 6-bladed beta-propeller [Pedobacter sp.]